jgi:hypothetical protein
MQMPLFNHKASLERRKERYYFENQDQEPGAFLPPVPSRTTSLEHQFFIVYYYLFQFSKYLVQGDKISLDTKRGIGRM